MIVFANTLDITIIVKFLALKKWVGEGANTGTPGRLQLCSFLATCAPEHDFEKQQGPIRYMIRFYVIYFSGVGQRISHVEHKRLRWLRSHPFRP